MNRLTVLFRQVMVGSMLLSGCIYAAPVQFSLALTYDNKTNYSIGRRLELSINNNVVGYVSYDISLTSYPSKISVLQVYPDHRGAHGYGKILLYSAINDIRNAGNQHIRLTRSPFNLKAGENWHTRDTQLRAWYEQFGFVATHGGSEMELSPNVGGPAQDVITAFGSDGINFAFKKALQSNSAEQFSGTNAPWTGGPSSTQANDSRRPGR